MAHGGALLRVYARARSSSALAQAAQRRAAAGRPGGAASAA